MKFSKAVLATLVASGLLLTGITPVAAASVPLLEEASSTDGEFHGTDPVLDGEALVAGRSYVISLGGVLNAGGTGFERYENRVLVSTGTDGRLESVNQFADTDATARSLPVTARWIVEGDPGDHALRATDGSGFLRLDAAGASISEERQSLDIATAPGDRFTITADVSGTTHHLDWDKTAAVFTSSTAGSSNSVFSVAEYRWGTEPLTPIATVPFSGLVDGGTYVFAHLGIFSVRNSAGAVALSNEGNGNPSPQLMRGDRFATIRDTAANEVQWRAERIGDQWALQALSYPGQYLNLDASGAYLGNTQGLELLEGADGTVKISAVSGVGTRLYVRFTAGSGGGWQAGTADGSNSFTIFDAPLQGAHPLPPYVPGEGGGGDPDPEEPIDPSLVTPVSATALESGKNYILGIPGITSTDKGQGTFALTSLDGDGSDVLREHAPFNDPTVDFAANMVWKVREFGEGYSLESPTVAGAHRFLNIDGGQLTMGTRQALDLTVTGDRVRVHRTVDGEVFNVRFTNLSGGGWQSGTPASTADFLVWEYSGAEHYTNGLVDAAALDNGGEYAVVLGGILNSAGTGWSRYTAYALSSDDPDTSGALAGVVVNADSRIADEQYWIIDRFGSGYSLRASAITGDPQYLTVTGTGDSAALALSTQPQVLNLDRRADGMVRISVNAGAHSVAFDGETNTFGARTGTVNDQISLWERRWSLAPLTAPARTTLADVQNGKSYVFAAPNVHVIGEQFLSTAMIGRSNGNASVGLMDSAAFGFTDAGAPELLQWRVARFGDGFSMQSLAEPTATGYLNIDVVDGVAHARLGERQELDLVATGSDAQITRVIDGTRHYIRYTAANGHGWQAATASSSSTFRIYETPVADLTPTLPLEKTDAADLDTAGSWAFVLDGAGPDGSAGALTSTRVDDGLAIEQFHSEEDTISPTQRWTLSRFGDGYAMLAEGATGAARFLNIGAGGLSLGAAQGLALEVGEDGTVQIHRGDDAAVSLADGAWSTAGAEGAASFTVYRINFPALQVPDEPTEREKADVTIAGLSDLHVDYGWQDRADPIRPSTRLAAERLREEDRPDLVLQGGDAISDNAKLAWSKTKWDNVTQNLEDLITGIPESGQALSVNGNHDYEVGLTGYNSGVWIDAANRAATGDYRTALYESADRDGNLAGYVTEVDGITIVALSTPYNGDGKYGSYHYTLEQIEWFEEQMSLLDADEVAIALTHYPLRDHRGGTGPGYGMSNDNGADDRIKAAMLPHRNLVHLYGHDHGAPFVETDAWEKVTAYNSDGTISQTRDHRADSFTSVFLGSTSYYNNRFNPGWLSATDPAVVQPLLMHVYDDRIEFEYKNYGAESGARQYPYTYTLPVLTTLASDQVDVADGVVSGIPHETTAAQLADAFDVDGGEIVVRDHEGTALEADREVRTDFVVQLVSDRGLVQDELRAVVDAAALPSHDWTVEAVRLRDAAGETTYALSDAVEITGVRLAARDESAAAGHVVVGVYDAEGGYLASAFAAAATGDVTLTLDVAGLPADATYRAYVVDSLVSARPLSEPLSSDGEKPLAANIAVSAETELVMGVDQAGNEIRVMHQSAADWSAPDALAWSWKPTAANGFDATRSSYTNVTDAKIRWNDFYDDYVVVTTASGGFVGLFDYATGEKLYESRLRAENNPHAVEVLPDGNIVAASSHGNSVIVYAATAADPLGWHQKYELPDAHAVVWDPDMNVLWAAGSNIVQGYELTGTRAEPTLTARSDMTHIMPEGGAHDMYVTYGQKDTFWLSGGENIFTFNGRSGEFSTDIPQYDLLNQDGAVKGLGNQPFTGNVIRIHPNFEKFSWNSDIIRLFEKTADGFVLTEKTFPRSEFYKARPWYPRYE